MLIASAEESVRMAGSPQPTNRRLPVLLLVAILLATLVAAKCWALAPITTVYNIVLPPGTTDWTDADTVRHVFHFRLLQPEWLSQPPGYPLYPHWAIAEAKARLIVVVVVWLATSTSVVLRQKGLIIHGRGVRLDCSRETREGTHGSRNVPSM